MPGAHPEARPQRYQIQVRGQLGQTISAAFPALRARVEGVTAEDIAASLVGIFTVARPPEHDARASRLLNILMDGLRSTP